MSKLERKDIPLADIRLDGGTQPRLEINMELVAEYKDAYERGDNMEPSDVFWDGSVYWLADGFHRWHGSNGAKAETLDCRVHIGTQRDAVLFSVGANATHGLKRTPADKKNAVMKLLNDAEWGKWSAREIAEKCNVGHSFVSEIRQTMSTADIVSEVQYKTKTGKTATRKVKPKPQQEVTPTTATVCDPEADRAAEIMKSQKTGKPAREPGDESENEPQAFKIQRSKTIKTVEALMRAFDDLHGMQSHRLQHAESIAACKILLKTAKDWSCK